MGFSQTGQPIRQHVVRQHATGAAAGRAEISLHSLLVLVGLSVRLGIPLVCAMALKPAMVAIRAALRLIARHARLT